MAAPSPPRATAPGRGATFSVRLPLRAVEEVRAGDGLAPATTQIRGGTLRGIEAAVDDHADARVLLRDALERAGASVRTAASAGEALHILSTRRFDVLVADIGMPEQDGLALMRILWGLPEGALNRQIPAIAVTAHTSERDREEALAAGFPCQLRPPPPTPPPPPRMTRRLQPKTMRAPYGTSLRQRRT